MHSATPPALHNSTVARICTPQHAEKRGCSSALPGSSLGSAAPARHATHLCSPLPRPCRQALQNGRRWQLPVQQAAPTEGNLQPSRLWVACLRSLTRASSWSRVICLAERCASCSSRSLSTSITVRPAPAAACSTWNAAVAVDITRDAYCSRPRLGQHTQ